MQSVAILDVGNSIVKGKAKTGRECYFPHALRPLPESKYEDVLRRAEGKPGPDYIRINGQGYSVGDAAESSGSPEKYTGAARYTKKYYGVLAVAMLARVFDRGGDVMVFASHAPQDLRYRDDLINAIRGTWHVEIGDSDRHFHIDKAYCFDEGLGGWANVVLAQDGAAYLRTDVNGGNALIIDVGGGTTDFIGIKEHGVIDYETQISLNVGILGALYEFEDALRANNRELFKTAGRGLRPERVREALRTGWFRGGGDPVHCENEARHAVSTLLGEIQRAYQHRAGGAQFWDSLILTGGGVGAIYDRLLPLLGHSRVILADDLETIHLANVRGGLKLWRMLEAS